MRGLAAVFSREVYERRVLALLALLGLVPIVLPWLGGSWARIAEDRGTVAMVLAAVASAVLALLLGATALAPELAERRLGFYFSRPLGAGAIWAGKLGAAFALSLAAALAVVAPSWLLGERAHVAAPHPMVVLWVLGLLVLVLVGHTLSVMARSRSPWLALDLAGAGIAGGLAWAATGRLAWEGAVGAYVKALFAVPLLLVLALVAASAAQVSLARNDLRRAHRVLSIWLAGLLVASGIALAGYSRWVLAAGPADLVEIERVTAAPAGDWIAVSGPVARDGDYRPGFLADASSGRFARTGTGSFTFYQTPLFSADGRRAVWLQTHGPGFPPPADVLYMDLDRPGARPVRTAIGYENLRAIDISPDGRHIAASSKGRLLVHELASGRLVASVPLRDSYEFRQTRFVGPGRIRIYTETFRDPERIYKPHQLSTPVTEIAEVDLATQEVEPTGLLHGTVGLFRRFSPDGERLIYWDGRPGTKTIRLADARTGQPLADLRQAGWTEEEGFPVFLSGGRLAFPARARGGLEVRLLGRDGALLPGFRFPGAKKLLMGGEASPGHLAVTVVTDEEQPGNWELRLLDAGSGASRTVAQGLAPLEYGWEGPTTDRAARLFRRSGGGLVWLDPATGRQRVVAPGVR